jgi:hypothetical protein
MDRDWLYAVGGALLIGALAWIDPIFIPLVLVGPLVTGFVVGRRGGPLLPLGAAWFLGGLVMLVSDAIANHEDKAFHAALSVVMALLASGAWFAGSRIPRRSTVNP